MSANPFPSIISFEKKENRFTSYSLSGILIKTIKFDSNILDPKITPLFNIYGGTFKDRIIVSYKNYCQIYSIYEYIR